ncbi:LAMI_0A00122g1_1 [Lachancea mirantina]|uniref:LAMI_0A00122g1_1 n=1 Tax=Lachancea mirantina TaxID=1230905 RepID=A0A1G4IL57_9SACH|nr:LAMI_0A00122g1_1 [Lachancea mirantina]
MSDNNSYALGVEGFDTSISTGNELGKHVAVEAKDKQPYSIYSNNEKMILIIIVSTAASFSGFASNIYYPSLPTIATELCVSVELVNLTITSYMIFQGLAPTFWGALADVKGRRITFICTFLVFFAACVTLANTRNYGTLVGVRCLQSTGSASSIALGAGVIGDITTRSERGGYMGIFQAGLLVPVAVGPIIGGGLAESLGWRSVFWFLAIYVGVFLIFLAILLPETLRSVAGNGSFRIRGFGRFPLVVYQRRYLRRNPCASIQTEANLPSKKPIDVLGFLKALLNKRVTLVIVFLAIYYTVWQMTITVLSTLLETTYKLSETQVGLTFIANGVGSMVGSLTTGKLLDKEYRVMSARYEGREDEMPIDHVRLRLMWLWSALQISSVLTFGWMLDKRIHMAVPIICTFLTGWAAMAIQSTVSTYMVDLFPDGSASASAAVNLARCLLGAGGTAAAMPILNGIGIGWGFTMLSAIMFAALGLIILQLHLGRKLRLQYQQNRAHVMEG